MEDIARHFAPVYRGTKLGTGISKGITIEEVGAYTVLRCPVINAIAIEAALKQVPVNKRPAISSDLIHWYRDFYGKQSNLTICCFDSKEMVKAQPIWIEYQPNDFTIGFYPGADSHDGQPPKIGSTVDRDQELFFGAVIDDQPGNVRFSQNVPFPIKNARWTKFNHVFDSDGTGENGDWCITIGGSREPGFLPGNVESKLHLRINTQARALCFAYELQK